MCRQTGPVHAATDPEAGLQGGDMRRIASLAGAIVATALLAAQPAAADGLNGAGKSPLFESGFSGWTCATGAVTTAVATEGFVVLNTEASGDLSAEVALK